MTQHKGVAVCGVMVFFMLTPSHICNMSMDMVIWYDKCVQYHTNCSCSITCQKMGYQKYLGQLCQPFIWRRQINCVQVSAFLLADGPRCGQMSVEYNQVRLAATGYM